MIVTDKYDLAVKISPKLVDKLEENKDAILAELGTIQRMAMKLAWNKIIAFVPRLAEAAVDEISKEFGSYTVDDFLKFISNKI